MHKHDYLYFFDGQWFESDDCGQLCPTTKRPELGIPDDIYEPLMDDEDLTNCNCD